MLRVNWHDEELKVRFYTSLTGDFVKLGTTTEYPFESGGTQGVPLNWSPYYENGGVYTDVSHTVGQGRYSIGNLVADVNGQSGKRYGAYRNFTVTPGKNYIVGLQCRTTAARSHTIRYVRYANGANHSYLAINQMWTFPDWETIAIYIESNYVTSGTLRVNLMACPYVSDPKGMMTDANWGIQFQGVTITEIDTTIPDPTWHEITCDTKQAQIRYGRDKFTSRYNVATAQIRVDNKSSYYTYGNGNTDELRPGRFIRGTITLPGTSTELPLYYGIIDSFTDAYDIDGNAFVELSCIDTASLLSNTRVPTCNSRDTIQGSWNRFRVLLASVGWATSMYRSQYSLFKQQALVSNGRMVRDELGLIADSEGGWFFADRLGNLVFYGRNWPNYNTKLTTVQAELLATPTRDVGGIDSIPTVPNPAIVELRSLSTDWTRDRIINDVMISNQEGTAFRYQDFESQKRNGPFTYQRLDFVNDNTTEPEYANQRANDLMEGYSDPIRRVNSVQFRPEPDTFEWCANAFLEELVRVRYQHPVKGWGWAVTSHIQGFQHQFSPTTWEMSVTLDHPESWSYWETADGSGWDVSIWDIDLWDEFGIEGGYWDSGQVWGDVNYLDSSKGYVSTPDLPKDTLVSNGTYRLTVDAQIDSLPAGQFPWLVQKIEGGTNFREYSMYQYQNGSVINWSGYNTANVDITVVNPIPYGARHSFGMEWTYGTTGGFAIVDGVRTARTSSVAPLAKDTTASILIGSSVASTGKVFGAKLERIVGGQVTELIWQFDASEWTGGSSYTDPRGRVWTFSNPAGIVGAPVDITAIWNE